MHLDQPRFVRFVRQTEMEICKQKKKEKTQLPRQRQCHQ